MKRGRGSRYSTIERDELMNKAFSLRREGKSHEVVAKIIDVSPSTIKRWEGKYKEKMLIQNEGNVKYRLLADLDTVERLKRNLLNLMSDYEREKSDYDADIAKNKHLAEEVNIHASTREINSQISKAVKGTIKLSPKKTTLKDQDIQTKKIQYLTFFSQKLKDLIQQHGHLIDQTAKILSVYDPTKYSQKEVHAIFLQLGVMFSKYIPEEARLEFEEEIEAMKSSGKGIPLIDITPQ